MRRKAEISVRAGVQIRHFDIFSMESQDLTGKSECLPKKAPLGLFFPNKLLLLVNNCIRKRPDSNEKPMGMLGRSQWLGSEFGAGSENCLR